MRTTLSINDDIAKLIENEVRRSGDSFKGTVNRLLRLGLMASKKPASTQPFVVKPFPFGLDQGRNYDNIGELIQELDEVDQLVEQEQR